MCKILCIPNLDPKLVKRTRRFVKRATQYMSVSERDGAGYAAINARGDVYGERWVKNADAWKVPTGRTPSVFELEARQIFKDVIDLTPKAERFGAFPSKGGRLSDALGIIVHTRFATTGSVELKNTHPFVRDGVALIHNGAVSNHTLFEKRVSTCDSEAILSQYLQERVANDLRQIPRALEPLDGYAACGILGLNENGRAYMDVFKTQGAGLVYAYIPMLRTSVFCTTSEILIRTCEALRWKIGTIHEVRAGIAMRVILGTSVTSTVEFDPDLRSYSAYTQDNVEWWKDQDDAAKEEVIMETILRAGGTKLG